MCSCICQNAGRAFITSRSSMLTEILLHLFLVNKRDILTKKSCSSRVSIPACSLHNKHISNAAKVQGNVWQVNKLVLILGGVTRNPTTPNILAKAGPLFGICSAWLKFGECPRQTLVLFSLYIDLSLSISPAFIFSYTSVM